MLAAMRFLTVFAVLWAAFSVIPAEAKPESSPEFHGVKSMKNITPVGLKPFSMTMTSDSDLFLVPHSKNIQGAVVTTNGIIKKRFTIPGDKYTFCIARYGHTIFLAGFANNVIHVMTESGDYITTMHTGVGMIFAVEATESALLVSDMMESIIHKLTFDSNYNITDQQVFIRYPGMTPNTIRVWNDRIYISSPLTFHVEVFSVSSGNHLFTVGSSSSKKEKFSPRDFTMDTEGRMYVVDAMWKKHPGKRVLVFDKDGKFIRVLLTREDYLPMKAMAIMLCLYENHLYITTSEDKLFDFELA
eukprot:GHVU01214217.1.p1 GENE.GHVU01214217.1~~GHVU01214217.1.p1  ORF type:complete len:301 (+),score=26.04 GHVU01214217.1:34-936(+)